MDETGTTEHQFLGWYIGFNIGKWGRNAYVICSSTEKKVYQAELGRTESVTMLECICVNDSKISPLIIFKGESIQTSWIPSESEMNSDWSWSSNIKGWIGNAIDEDWIRTVFESATHTNATWLLIVDGHSSHVIAPFIRFCIDHDILVLLLPLHSSHLTQPLDVGIFSPLKHRISKELDKILRYGFSNIKKFEWANCYCIARPGAIEQSNIKSAWSRAGLIPFNPWKIIRHINAALSEQETTLINNSNSVTNASTSEDSKSYVEKFSLVPHTSSKIDSVALWLASEALVYNVQTGIFDTLMREYILKESGLVTQYETCHIVREKHLDGMNEINKRRVMAFGKHVVLKDQTVITTEGIYEQVKACEEATNKRWCTKGHMKQKSGLQAALNSTNDMQTTEEEEDITNSRQFKEKKGKGKQTT